MVTVPFIRHWATVKHDIPSGSGLCQIKQPESVLNVMVQKYGWKVILDLHVKGLNKFCMSLRTNREASGEQLRSRQSLRCSHT